MLQLINHLLPEGAEVNVSTGRPRWFLQRRHRRVGADVVAAQYLELAAAGGRDGFAKVGCEWNCRHRVFGFDIDAPAGLGSEEGSRGCNHPTVDGGGRAVAHLRELVEERTGGELIAMHNPDGGGIWLIGVAPTDVDTELLAQDLLRQMRLDGFQIGKGALELPLSNARLPLAGYVLEGHEHLPWIEQVGELVSWLDEQSDAVTLRRPIYYSAKQLDLLFPIDAGRVFDHAGVTFTNLRWMPEHRSNGFLGACAIRMAKAGHGAESAALMASMVEAHPDWVTHASNESQRRLGSWCLRWLQWAERNVKADAAKPAGLSNAEKYQQWCAGVRAGVANAVSIGKTGITEVINHLVAHRFVGSKRICWGRRDLIQDGIERELLALEMASQQGCLAVTTTQLIPMGVMEAEVESVSAAEGCSRFEDLDLAVPVPPVPSAVPGSCGVTCLERGSTPDPGLISQIRSGFESIRAQFVTPIKAGDGERGSRWRERDADDDLLTPIKRGRNPVLTPDQRRERERAELAAWIANTA